MKLFNFLVVLSVVSISNCSQVLADDLKPADTATGTANEATKDAGTNTDVGTSKPHDPGVGNHAYACGPGPMYNKHHTDQPTIVKAKTKVKKSK